jgi:dephospho-CoA kinase
LIKEAAILLESGSYKTCDLIILVTANLENRINRVIARDKTTREEVLNRINNQWSDEKKTQFADFIIVNDEFEKVEEQINLILKTLKYKI